MGCWERYGWKANSARGNRARVRAAGKTKHRAEPLRVWRPGAKPCQSVIAPLAPNLRQNIRPRTFLMPLTEHGGVRTASWHRVTQCRSLVHSLSIA